MTSPTEAYPIARNMAVDMLKDKKQRSEADIRATVGKVVGAIKTLGLNGEVDDLELTAELMHLFSISAERATALDDSRDHVAWLPSQRASIPWRFWNRYATYLERGFGMPPDVVNNLDELTDMILERLESPTRPGAWDRRGMVVGSVQSGKTANYTGLVNKAVDSGYKLLIILAGIHSNLRSQTQLRIDEGVLGFDTQKGRKLDQDNRWVGVGQLPGDRPVIHSLTSSAEDGDFNKRIAETIGVRIGGDPVVLVVKKNSHVLKNLLKWVLHMDGVDDAETNRRLVKNVPLLLIDDEADNASINTKSRRRDEDEDTVSAINGMVRDILSSFEKSSYVGYTATPFANIFVNPDAQSDKHGDDIFPRSFIINVKAPSNYVGPEKVFGLDGDPDANIPASEGLPIVRPITDHDDENAFPTGHKIDHVPLALPTSLKVAIRCFVLSSAARRARGQGKKHCSMLIHVTRFVAVQNRIAQLVKTDVLGLQRRLANGDGTRTPTFLDELQKLWESEFVPTTAALGEDAGAPVSWDQVCAELHNAASKIAVLPINGFAKEALDYKEHEAEGRNVIAVGGNKLSRGLTLEGLTVSYFVRTTKMYDTLMQMGRWFGYRPGYLDLCRLFTTRELTLWYRHIALAETELRREFDYMVRAGLTPENYGLRVRTHPEGMIVTAMNKMCHSQRLELSWAGVLVQTAVLPKDTRLANNALVTESFIQSLSREPEQEGDGPFIWRDVPAATVAAYLGGTQYPIESSRASGEELERFILTQASQGELISWTVVLVSSSLVPADARRKFAGRKVGFVTRNPRPGSQRADSYGLRKANILSPRDEGLDLTSIPFGPSLAALLAAKPILAPDRDFLLDEATRTNGQNLWDVALTLTRKRLKDIPSKTARKSEPDVPHGRVLRELRPKTHGLLLIYPMEQCAKILAVKKEGVEITPSEDTGLNPAGPPVIGLAISFPESETAIRIEYQVNKRWNAALQEDLIDDD